MSFTFDDFPRSALLAGGAILKRWGFTATYYASFGLMGKEAPTGTMFVPEDIHALLDAGHELGCHTFTHCHSWDTPPARFEQAILQNNAALAALCPTACFRTLSYPISPPRPLTKRAAGKYFACCRGSGQTFNAAAADLNYLSGYFLEKDRERPQKVKAVIDENRRARGWLILATHDISRTPTPFGCTPEFFERAVEYAAESGARILPVAAVIGRFEGWSEPPATDRDQSWGSRRLR